MKIQKVKSYTLKRNSLNTQTKRRIDSYSFPEITKILVDTEHNEHGHSIIKGEMERYQHDTLYTKFYIPPTSFAAWQIACPTCTQMLINLGADPKLALERILENRPVYLSLHKNKTMSKEQEECIDIISKHVECK